MYNKNSVFSDNITFSDAQTVGDFLLRTTVEGRLENKS